jgi:hypothetical protein
VLWIFRIILNNDDACKHKRKSLTKLFFGLYTSKNTSLQQRKKLLRYPLL